MNEYVILVDDNNSEIGTSPKLEAHMKGLLHRAFSVFVFNSKGELLLQQRASGKYHSGGLWTNTCCSHPRPGEPVEEAAIRRLREEMGLSCKLKKVFDFVYYVKLAEDLIEHEFDHVLIGISNDKPVINQEEVADYRYIKLEDLKSELVQHPERYTEWFKIAINQVIHEKVKLNKNEY